MKRERALPRWMIHVHGTVAFDTVALTQDLPAPNETVRVQSMSTRHGGTAGNVAMALARLGSRPRLVSAVGEDFAGSAYERQLVEVGVDLGALVRASGRSASAFIVSADDGRQMSFYAPGATPEMAKAQPIACDFGHFAAGEISCYPARMERCRVVSFDPGQETFHRDPSEIVACLPRAHYLFANEHELAHLRRALDLTVNDLLGGNMRAVVETRGARGQVVHAPQGRLEVPAAPAKAVDPTGAGDAHRAGFVHALARGASLVEAARLGAVVAAHAVEAVGPQANLPTLAQCRERYLRAFGDWPFDAQP